MKRFIVVDGTWAIIPVGRGYHLSPIDCQETKDNSFWYVTHAEHFKKRITEKYNFSPEYFVIKEI